MRYTSTFSLIFVFAFTPVNASTEVKCIDPSVERLARQAMYLERVEACIRTEKTEDDAQRCVDRLILADAQFALARAEARGMLKK